VRRARETESYPWPYRRIATEEAFSVPEVYEALRGWAATADPAEPDQDFWDFVFTQDTPGLRRVRRQQLDLDGERLEIMDANGVDVQLLSLTAPGVQTFPPAEGTAGRGGGDRPGRDGAEAERRDHQLAHRQRVPGRGEVLAAARGGRGAGRAHLHPPALPAAQMAAAFKKYGLETGIWGFQAARPVRLAEQAAKGCSHRGSRTCCPPSGRPPRTAGSRPAACAAGCC
jgi:hypothetical protein